MQPAVSPTETPVAPPASSSESRAASDERLDAIFAAYEQRALDDPVFANFRVEPRTGSDPWPDGWYPSDAVARLVKEGGWWPGGWELASSRNPLYSMEPMLDYEFLGNPAGDVIWMSLGRIWEHDMYATPLMREPHATAPVAVAEGQSLRLGVAFPDEASLFEAFLDAVEVESDDAELLAEWVISGPLGDDEAERAAQQKVLQRIVSNGSDHPLWHPSMPLYIDPMVDQDLADLLLGRPRE